MRLLDWLRGWLWPAPIPARRLRAVCDLCGKEVAVIASTGKLWRHVCLDDMADGDGARNQGAA